MRIVDIITKKRDGDELTCDEIYYFIEGYTSGEIPDYQASALAMAIYFQGMTPRETTDLTLAIVRSGERLDLSQVVEIAVDKHSTGGVGDKTTLVVGPIVSACGLPVGKMSGRGLGFSGGTLDKMESIPGYRCDLTTNEFLDQLQDIGLVLTGQSVDLAPADGKLYALRDVTATVQSIPLIASSVMSKKIAAGAQAILLDVKVGLGAFMKTVADARNLAALMVEIGKLADRNTVALLSDMNQPLGHAVGNALEVKEAIDTLQGGGPKDFKDHCLSVSGRLLEMGRIVPNEIVGFKIAEESLAGQQAWMRFRDLVNAQGGDVSYIDHPEKLPTAQYIETAYSTRSGYLSEINAQIVGETVVQLGGGRAKKNDLIDCAVGVVVHQKVGNFVEAGQPLFTIHANKANQIDEYKKQLNSAHKWSDDPVEPLPLFYDVVM